MVVLSIAPSRASADAEEWMASNASLLNLALVFLEPRSDFLLGDVMAEV